MNSKQNNAGSFQGISAPNGDLPKIIIERQNDALFGFRQIQEDGVLYGR